MDCYLIHFGIIFANLKPGNYKFELISCNENNYCTEQALEIYIVIKPAFWQTWIFKIVTTLLFISLIILSVFYFFKAKERKRKKEIQLKKDLMQMQISSINAQLDPHFVFNSITAISYLVQEDDKDVAYNYFVKLSRLLRDTLSTRKLITRTLQEELEFVSNYLSLQKLRFGNRFNYKFQISKNTDYNFIVPKMCIQIFIENSIKHGLEPLTENGELIIKIIFYKMGFYAIIKDNGIGIESSKLKNKNSEGIGIQSFIDFFNLLNEININKAGFKIKSSSKINNKSTGTTVILFIPYNYQYSFK